MNRNMMAFFSAGVWISLSEFVRNELLLKSYWLQKYASLGLQFPSAPMNNAFWGIWSFLFAGVTLFLVGKLKFIESILVLWTLAFLMMWITIGNLNVLPFGLLLFAVPMSLLEVAVAVLLCKKLSKQ
jgi:hypothetical protein